MVTEPKFAIVGAGPVGGILGAYLARAGCYVILCDVVKSHLDAIAEKGLQIVGGAEMTTQFDGLVCSISDLADFPEVDTLVLSTKASIMPRLIPEIKALARPTMRFVSCQNGLDNEEYLGEHLGTDNVLRIVVNYAGGIAQDGQIKMNFFNKPNYIGALTTHGEPLACQIADLLTRAGLDTEFTPHIKKYEWEKAILNAGLSAVCALARKPMKDMMDLKPTECLAEALVREGIAVAEASGVKFDAGFFEHCMQYLHKAGYHKTSMHVDLERGAPTEIDWLNGKIVERGRALGIPTPHNFAITALVKGAELRSSAPEGH